MSLQQLKIALRSNSDFNDYYNKHTFEEVYSDIMSFKHEANDLFEMTKSVASGLLSHNQVNLTDFRASSFFIIATSKEIIEQLNEQ